MPNFGTIAKYLSLFTIGKGIIDKVVLQKMLVGGTAIIAATVVVAILVGALIIAALGGIYYALVTSFPIKDWAALLIVSSLVVALIAFLVYKIVDGIKRIAAATAVLTTSASPLPIAGSITNTVTDVVSAFLSGLKDHTESEKADVFQHPSSKKTKRT